MQTDNGAMFGAIVGAVKELGGAWLETRKVKAEAKRETIRANAKADAAMREAQNARLLANSSADNFMDIMAMRQMRNSYKDEVITALLLAPYIVTVIDPAVGAEIARAFNTFPAWFNTFVVIIIGAQMGVRGMVGAMLGFRRGGGAPKKTLEMTGSPPPPQQPLGGI